MTIVFGNFLKYQINKSIIDRPSSIKKHLYYASLVRTIHGLRMSGEEIAFTAWPKNPLPLPNF